MAAQRGSVRPRRISRPGRWSLRAKLTCSMVALLAVVCLITGVASEFALGRFLDKQTDQQLRAAADRAMSFARGGSHGPEQPGPQQPGHTPIGQTGNESRNPLNGLGQGPGTVLAIFSGGTMKFGGSISDKGSQVGLDTTQRAVLLGVPPDGNLYTRVLGDLGDYRLMARKVPDSGEIVVTGVPLGPAHDTLVTVGVILFAVALAGLLGAAFLGAFAVRRTLRPLDRVAATASRVSELPLDRGDVALSVRVPESETDPRTEVGQVGSALNLMLGHVSQALQARQASELRVRQFVADASHELRTPLAAIRGYAELASRGRTLVPPDVAHSMTRIQSEAVRMTALVEDLLLLARLDAGRPLDIRELDLSRLVADAVGDAQVAGRTHHWLLELPPEPVVVLGDVQRLHQVLANLLANARTHTPPGTTVATALSRSADGSAVLTVTDNGPGIPQHQLPDVFQRFARGDSSRSRTAGSTGLGLAIAAAVVVAHHGTIEVHSRPGWTEFAVRLPALVPAQRAHSLGTSLPQLGA